MKLSPLLLALVLLASSCASSGYARKWNGAKGVQTRMGVL